MKQKRYWLRGGVIGLIAICLYVLFIVLSGSFAAGLMVYLPTLSLLNTLGLCSQSGSMLSSGSGICTPDLRIVPVILIEFVIIGIILGWIYGKMKNRREIDTMTN